MKTIYCDIDGTICTKVEDANYEKAQPIPERILKMNTLYRKGCHIVYWTARGSQTGKDWSDLTKKQFKEWGVKYNNLVFGKPEFDLFIDDKAVNAIVLEKI